MGDDPTLAAEAAATELLPPVTTTEPALAWSQDPDADVTLATLTVMAPTVKLPKPKPKREPDPLWRQARFDALLMVWAAAIIAGVPLLFWWFLTAAAG